MYYAGSKFRVALDTDVSCFIPCSIPQRPWTLQAESWLFLGYHSNSQIHQIQSEPLKSQENLVLSANARIEQAAGLFPGSYHPLEDLPDVLRVGEKPERLKRDQFEGGLCGWILFRLVIGSTGNEELGEAYCNIPQLC